MQPTGFQPSGFQQGPVSTGPGPTPGPGSAFNDLLQESGFQLLQEDGTYILLEQQDAVAPPGDGSALSDLKQENGYFILQEDGTYILLEQQDAVVVPTKPPGGDDAPRWVNPTYVKEKKRERPHQVEEDLEALYDRVMGIEPVTKEAKKAVKAVKRAIEPHREPDGFDWEAIERDLKVAIALRRAAKALEDDDDEALTALLLAG